MATVTTAMKKFLNDPADVCFTDTQHVPETQPNSRRGAVAAGPGTGEDFAVLAGLRCASEVSTGATRGRGVAVLDFAQDV